MMRTNKPYVLPNFICPGAQKCGTTTLQRVLNQHPDIYLSPTKELRFFVDGHYSSREGRYERFFREWSGQLVVGDITPEYLFEKNAPKRIYDMLGPDVKFIIMLRNPADRAFSQYRMHERSGSEKRTFPAIVREEIEKLEKSPDDMRYPGYVARGLYARQIQRYREIFPADQIKIVVLEELIAQPDMYYRDILRFLGVDADVQLKYDLTSNADFIPSHKRLYAISLAMVSKTMRFLSRFMTEARRKKTRKALGKLIIGHGNYIPVKQKIDPESKRILMDFYQKDIEALETLAGRDFDLWKATER